jgi:hypothetical protein
MIRKDAKTKTKERKKGGSMKKMLLGILVVCCVLSFATAGYCWTFGKKKEAQPAATTEKVVKSEKAVTQPQAPAQQASKMSQKDIDKMRAQRDKKRAELNNLQWDVDVTAINGKGEKKKDYLIFQDNKFSSDEATKSGFQPSNYTLTIQDSGAVVLETMQMAEKEGAIFWRVEFDNTLNTCHGVFSRQSANGKGEDYSFASTAKKPVVAKVVVPPVEEKKEEVKK